LDKSLLLFGVMRFEPTVLCGAIVNPPQPDRSWTFYSVAPIANRRRDVAQFRVVNEKGPSHWRMKAVLLLLSEKPYYRDYLLENVSAPVIFKTP